MLRFVALRGQHGGGKRYATGALRSCRGRSVVRAQETHGYTPLQTWLICLFGAPHVPDAVPLAKRPYRPCRVALAYIVAVAGVARLQLLACSRRGRCWSRKTSVACCVIIELLRVHRSVRPKGAKGDSPGQSEAPPWVRLRDGSIGSPALKEPFGPNLGGFRGR
jgi:hypothetical protein